MGMSALDKAVLIIKGGVHNFLDGLANTPAAYRQRIRNVEVALADLKAAGDEQRGLTVGYDREIAELRRKIDLWNADADLLASDANKANDVEIPNLEAKIEDTTTRIAELQALAKTAHDNFAMIQENVMVVEGQLSQLSDKYRELVSTTSMAKSQASLAETLAAAQDAMDDSVDASVDSPIAAARHQNDVATAALRRTISEMKEGRSAEDAARLSRAEQAAAARIARLNNKAAEEMAKPA